MAVEPHSARSPRHVSSYLPRGAPLLRYGDTVMENCGVNSSLLAGSAPTSQSFPNMKTVRRDAPLGGGRQECAQREHTRVRDTFRREREGRKRLEAARHDHLPVQKPEASKRRTKGPFRAYHREVPHKTRDGRKRKGETHTSLTAACATALRTLTATIKSMARTAHSKGSREIFS